MRSSLFIASVVLVVSVASLACSETQQPSATQTDKESKPLVAMDIATEEVGSPVALHQLAIPAREHGYSKLESQLIASRQELDTLLDLVRDQEHWNKKEDFLEAVTGANLDFPTDVLVLVRHTEGSGTPRVWLEEPMIRQSTREVVLKVSRDSPPYGTCDMAYYCYAVVIPRSLATTVTIKGTFTSAKYIVDGDGKQQLREGHRRDLHFEMARNGVVE